jgi:hypothetical protein
MNVTDYLAREGIPCKIQTSNVTRYEERYLELFHLAWNNQKTNGALPERKRIQWFAIGDDDTLWFINNLLHTLRQYNSSNKIYLGDVSDAVSQIARHGDSFAYGGGDILLSRPLALLFAQHFQLCGRSIYIGGDGMIGRCVYQVSNVSLTKNKNFHQMDHSGDITGIFESGIDGLVSLHHMQSWWKPFPDGHNDKLNETMYLLELAYKTFDRDFLKRYVHFNYKTNQTLLLTMGYSFHVFNRILSHEELTQVERTWCCSEMFGRKFRPKEDNKTTWYFRDLITKSFKRTIRHEMVFENKKEMSGHFLHIKVTL